MGLTWQVVSKEGGESSSRGCTLLIGEHKPACQGCCWCKGGGGGTSHGPSCSATLQPEPLSCLLTALILSLPGHVRSNTNELGQTRSQLCPFPPSATAIPKCPGARRPWRAWHTCWPSRTCSAAPLSQYCALGHSHAVMVSCWQAAQFSSPCLQLDP